MDNIYSILSALLNMNNCFNNKLLSVFLKPLYVATYAYCVADKYGNRQKRPVTARKTGLCRVWSYFGYFCVWLQ